MEALEQFSDKHVSMETHGQQYNTTIYNFNIELGHTTGLTLDKGLTWKKQLGKAINEAYKAFWTCRGTFGKTWGLTPRVVYWIYTAVVSAFYGPPLTYIHTYIDTRT
jgi:hypothetical protein